MSTEVKISLLDQLKSAIRRFEAVQLEYSMYGARDTEPNAIFARIMCRAIKGKPVDIPADGDGWELYNHSMDCGEAAAAMFQAARAAVEIVQTCPLGESRELRKYIEGWFG